MHADDVANLFDNRKSVYVFRENCNVAICICVVVRVKRMSQILRFIDHLDRAERAVWALISVCCIDHHCKEIVVAGRSDRTLRKLSVLILEM